jgi:hypothetical protein
MATRTHKYAARRTVYNGQTYPSKAEAEYARHLDLLQAGGVIERWTRATGVSLLECEWPGWGLRYTADFWVFGHQTHGDYWVEVKGPETEAFRMRVKLLRHRSPLVRLLIVKPDGSERWAW